MGDILIKMHLRSQHDVWERAAVAVHGFPERPVTPRPRRQERVNARLVRHVAMGGGHNGANPLLIAVFQHGEAVREMFRAVVYFGKNMGVKINHADQLPYITMF